MDLAPDFLFMDLDLGTLLTMEKLDEALTCTLSNIKEKLDGVPSVIWSGGGYHIYQPVDAFCDQRNRKYLTGSNSLPVG